MSHMVKPRIEYVPEKGTRVVYDITLGRDSGSGNEHLRSRVSNLETENQHMAEHIRRTNQTMKSERKRTDNRINDLEREIESLEYDRWLDSLPDWKRRQIAAESQRLDHERQERIKKDKIEWLESEIAFQAELSAIRAAKTDEIVIIKPFYKFLRGLFVAGFFSWLMLFTYIVIL